MAIKLVIFDVDGVFIEVPRKYFIEARKRIVSILEEYGVEISIESPFFKRVYDAVMSIANIPEIGLSLYKYLSRVAEEYELKSLEEIRIKIDARNLLKGLKDRGYRLAVFSQGGKKYVEKVLDRLEIINLLDIYLTRDDVKPKPYPDGLIKICRSLGVNADEAVYVGDTFIDAETALRAGVKSIILSNRHDMNEKYLENAIILKRFDLDSLVEILEEY